MFHLLFNIPIEVWLLVFISGLSQVIKHFSSSCFLLLWLLFNAIILCDCVFLLTIKELGILFFFSTHESWCVFVVYRHPALASQDIFPIHDSMSLFFSAMRIFDISNFISMKSHSFLSLIQNFCCFPFSHHNLNFNINSPVQPGNVENTVKLPIKKVCLNFLVLMWWSGRSVLHYSNLLPQSRHAWKFI